MFGEGGEDGFEGFGCCGEDGLLAYVSNESQQSRKRVWQMDVG